MVADAPSPPLHAFIEEPSDMPVSAAWDESGDQTNAAKDNTPGALAVIPRPHGQGLTANQDEDERSAASPPATDPVNESLATITVLEIPNSPTEPSNTLVLAELYELANNEMESGESKADESLPFLPIMHRTDYYEHYKANDLKLTQAGKDQLMSHKVGGLSMLGALSNIGT